MTDGQLVTTAASSSQDHQPCDPVGRHAQPKQDPSEIGRNVSEIEVRDPVLGSGAATHAIRLSDHFQLCDRRVRRPFCAVPSR